jgi:hypothetical protein
MVLDTPGGGIKKFDEALVLAFKEYLRQSQKCAIKNNFFGTPAGHIHKVPRSRSRK